MSPNEWKDLEVTCTSLHAATRALLKWGWDGRLGAVLATFQEPDAAAVKAHLAAHLPLRWDRSNLREAPRLVRDLADAIGGVRADQAVYATDATRPVVAVGAWWPWGGGQTVSIRIFPVASGLAPADQEALAAAFRGWFGL